MIYAFAHRWLFGVIVSIAVIALTLAVTGWGNAEGKTNYELVKDIFVPLLGPIVAVLIPVLVLFVIPFNQSRQKIALDLCTMYNAEEMREARNIGWRIFVTEQRQLPPVRRAERLNHFLDYLSEPEAHRAVDPDLDANYQKTSRVLDFFALVNGCIARGVVDPDMVRDFLVFYYLWWREEIMDPLRRTRRMTSHSTRFRPSWWEPLTHLDALVNTPPRSV